MLERGRAPPRPSAVVAALQGWETPPAEALQACGGAAPAAARPVAVGMARAATEAAEAAADDAPRPETLEGLLEVLQRGEDHDDATVVALLTHNLVQQMRSGAAPEDAANGVWCFLARLPPPRRRECLAALRRLARRQPGSGGLGHRLRALAREVLAIEAVEALPGALDRRQSEAREAEWLLGERHARRLPHPPVPPAGRAAAHRGLGSAPGARACSLTGGQGPGARGQGLRAPRPHSAPPRAADGLLIQSDDLLNLPLGAGGDCCARACAMFEDRATRFVVGHALQRCGKEGRAHARRAACLREPPAGAQLRGRARASAGGLALAPQLRCRRAPRTGRAPSLPPSPSPTPNPKP